MWMVVDYKRFVKHAPLEPESGTPRPLAPRRARTPALRRARTPPPSPARPCAPPRPAWRAGVAKKERRLDVRVLVQNSLYFFGRDVFAARFYHFLCAAS